MLVSCESLTGAEFLRLGGSPFTRAPVRVNAARTEAHMNVQDRALTALLPEIENTGAPLLAETSMLGGSAPLGNDRIQTFPGPAQTQQLQSTNPLGGALAGFAGFGGAESPGGLSGMLSQLMGMLQQLLGLFGLGNTASQPMQPPQPSSDQYFNAATGSSTGDPHLSFSGTDQSGTQQQAHYDDMTSQSDLLDSDSFDGGYQISTQVTQPNANGVTYNQSATVTTGYGGTQVTLDNAGNATILQNGQSTALADGQSMNLVSGETVTRNADGSLSITDQSAAGGSVTTSLSENGNGVDVNVQAQNVDLGGSLVDQAQPQGPQPPAPLPPNPLPFPTPGAHMHIMSERGQDRRYPSARVRIQ